MAANSLCSFVLLVRLCMAEKRHLNVIGSSATTEPVVLRSNIQWVVIGTLLVVLTWLPLAMLGLWLSRLGTWGIEVALRGSATTAQWAGPSAQFLALALILGSFALAAYLGGWFIARFGATKSTLIAWLTGGLAGALVVTIAAAAGSLSPWIVGVVAYMTLIFVGAIAASWGGRRGQRQPNTASLMPPTLP